MTAYRRFLLLIRSNAALASAWQGIAFRTVARGQDKPATVFSGHGSLEFGGRWNAPGSFRAVYGSTTPEVAIAESLAYFRYYGHRVEDAMPRTMLALDLKLHRVIDLTNAIVQRKLRISWKQIYAEDWRKLQDAGKESLSQALGRAIFDAGLEGLIAPSARIPHGVNIAFFPDQKAAGSIARIHRKSKHP